MGEAAVALGALHKCLDSAQDDNDNDVGLTLKYYSVALQKYGKAVRRLRESLMNGESQCLRTILISIILFNCFHTLTGDYKSAIAQLQCGLDLIHERFQKHTQDLRRNDEIEDELLQIFQRFAIQAKFAYMILHFPLPYVIKLAPPKYFQKPTSPQSPLSAAATID